MIKQFARYDSYKDSGVEWLGEIPVHWEVRKLKYFGYIYAGIANKSGNDFSKELRSNFKKFIPFTNICNNYIINNNDMQYVNVKDNENQNIVMHGDLLFLMSSETLDDIGKSSLYLGNEAVYLNSFCKGFRLKAQINRKYVNYLLNSNSCRIYFSLYGRGFTRINIKQEYINDILITDIPHSEQQRIADFLDKKTAQIDEAITKKERMIELLKEYRQVVINNAVTKGLDPNVAMKDSGVEWLGQIPAHWEITAVKHTLSMPITDGPHITPKLIEDGIPFISAESIKNGEIDFGKKRGYISLKDHSLFSLKYSPCIGDIYMVKSGATTGNVAIVKHNFQFSIWSPLAVFRSNSQKLFNKFLFFALQSEYFKTGVTLNWSFGTQQNIGMGILSDLPITITSIDEQKQIADFLDKKTTQIDEAISLKQSEIEKLKEYKATLIDSAVTGKIKV